MNNLFIENVIVIKATQRLKKMKKSFHVYIRFVFYHMSTPFACEHISETRETVSI